MSLERWFEEESFTYIRVFGSLSHPHVLPIFIPDKFLAREIAYQIVGNGLTKVLKDAKKTTWPYFLISCGIYALENFRHALV